MARKEKDFEKIERWREKREMVREREMARKDKDGEKLERWREKIKW